MIDINRLKKIAFKAFIAFTFALNLIAIPTVFFGILNHIRQLKMEAIYDNFESQNVVFSTALAALIMHKEMEFTSADVYESGHAVKYRDMIEPATEINGEMKISYGYIRLDVEPIPGIVKRIWTQFPAGYSEKSQKDPEEVIKKFKQSLAENYKHREEYSDATADFDQGNYPAALNKFKALVDIYPGLTVKIGLMYKNGQGTGVDYKQAEEWFLKSADTGKTTANQELAKLYEEHIELNGDFAKIAERYMNKAQYGHPPAQEALAKMYEAGRGVSKNLVVARALYNLSTSESDFPLEKEDTLQAFKRLDKQLTIEQAEESAQLTNKILRYGHLKNALSEYFAQKNIQDGI